MKIYDYEIYYEVNVNICLYDKRIHLFKILIMIFWLSGTVYSLAMLDLDKSRGEDNKTEKQKKRGDEKERKKRIGSERRSLWVSINAKPSRRWQ